MNSEQLSECIANDRKPMKICPGWSAFEKGRKISGCPFSPSFPREQMPSSMGSHENRPILQTKTPKNTVKINYENT